MMPSLNLVHLYPSLLNLYGDRGNIISLRQRCAWRGIDLHVHTVDLGSDMPDVPVDMFFMGGDQDREQKVVVDDLRERHSRVLQEAVELGIPVLAVCGSYQLLQRYYRPAEGADLVGLGIFDAYTEHPGANVPRCVGNIVLQWNESSIVGFENHGGRTFLGPNTQPLGRVRHGFGNNGIDGTEGARTSNVFGTYVHGSLLPKNPHFADMLLTLALERRYPGLELQPLDDTLENRAREAAIQRAGRSRYNL